MLQLFFLVECMFIKDDCKPNYGDIAKKTQLRPNGDRFRRNHHIPYAFLLPPLDELEGVWDVSTTSGVAISWAPNVVF